MSNFTPSYLNGEDCTDKPPIGQEVALGAVEVGHAADVEEVAAGGVKVEDGGRGRGLADDPAVEVGPVVDRPHLPHVQPPDVADPARAKRTKVAQIPIRTHSHFGNMLRMYMYLGSLQRLP